MHTLIAKSLAEPCGKNDFITPRRRRPIVGDPRAEYQGRLQFISSLPDRGGLGCRI